jgi:biopolymer transport protein ExbD
VRFGNPRREDVDLNITPLIDIVFLLLIFFMVSTTFQKESELRVQLPQAEQEESVQPKRPLEIVISADGQYAIGGRTLADNSLPTLLKSLRTAVGDDREQPLVVRADARTPHQAVVRAMDAASQLGLSRLSIATARNSGGNQ